MPTLRFLIVQLRVKDQKTYFSAFGHENWHTSSKENKVFLRSCQSYQRSIKKKSLVNFLLTLECFDFLTIKINLELMI